MIKLARGIIVVDYDFNGNVDDFIAAKTALEKTVRELQKSGACVVNADCDMRERREGSSHNSGKGLDVSKLKVQSRV